MLNIAVFVSGGGTNLQAIIDSLESGTITNTKLGLVVSNKEDSYALERAKKHKIPTEVLSVRAYPNINCPVVSFHSIISVLSHSYISLSIHTVIFLPLRGRETDCGCL